MFNRQGQGSGSPDTASARDETAPGSSDCSTTGSSLYHPSRVFRGLIQSRGTVVGAATAPQTGKVGRAPTLIEVLSAATAVGVLSGLLELGVLFAQVRGFHLVDWSTLMISRHAAWMIPATGAAVVVLLALALVSPILLLAARRVRRRPEDDLPGPAWDWAGMVLGTLLLLGPLLAVRGLHPMAPLGLSVGVGFRIRRLLVRPTPRWRRRIHGAAMIGVAVLGMLVLSQRHSGASNATRPSIEPGTRSSNILWIVLDTLRADRMSLYGYERSTTPELQAWAKRGITFDMARSTAPWTLPSHVSMFTGLLPSEHGACVDRCYYGAAPTLAEHLRAQGYTTAGIVANVRMCNTAYGVGRGFDYYVDYPWRGDVSIKAAMSNSALGAVLMDAARRWKLPVPDAYPFIYKQPGSKIATKAREWLYGVQERCESVAGSVRPFFLFLNFMDVHAYYLPPADRPRRFWTGPVPPNRDACPEAGWRALQARDAADAEHRPPLQSELDATTRRLGDLYDDCIAGLDAELGRFLGDLRDRGLLANTWVVITADHGEHFGEHGAFGHGSSLYNEQTHVPLILLPPLGSGRSAGDPFAGLRDRRIGVPISLRELPRTMADLLLPGSANPFPGHGLARYWNADRPERPEAVYSELEDPRLKGEDFRTENVSRIGSIIDDDHILITYKERPPELFALFVDPKQQNNLADRADQQARRQRMEAALDAEQRRVLNRSGSR